MRETENEREWEKKEGSNQIELTTACSIFTPSTERCWKEIWQYIGDATCFYNNVKTADNDKGE